MKLAIFQCAPGATSSDERIDRLVGHIAEAQPELVLCPELFLSGYHVGEQLRELAEPVNGPSFARLSSIASQTNTAIVYGFPEHSGAELYNAAICIGASGQCLAHHRKQLNSPNSFELDYFAEGNGCSTFSFQEINFGLLICYEVEVPEIVRRTCHEGAQVLLVLTALAKRWDFVATRMVPTRAFENGAWLAYANHAGHENGLDYLGGSRVVAPDGSEVAVAGAQEEFIVAEINLSEVNRARERLPYLRDVERLAERYTSEQSQTQSFDMKS